MRHLLQLPRVLAVIVGLSSIFSTVLGDISLSNAARTGGGDFTNLNAVLNNLVLALALSIEPKEIDYKFGIITVPLTATVGEIGECVDLKFNEGGDILVTGKFLEGTFNVDGFDEPMQAYEVEVSAQILQFECTIPLKVEVDGFFSFVNTVDGFGDLTFRSEAAILSQKIMAYSPDFSSNPPVFAEPGACVADPDVLTYTGDDLGEVATFSITDIVIEELESDPSYVFNDVSIELCKLGNDLAVLLSGLFVNNQFTNTSSGFIVPDPFSPDENGTVPALVYEYTMKEEIDNKTESDLLNLTDTDNIFVNLFVPEDPETVSIINTLLEMIVDPDDESTLDPVLLFLADTFELELQPNGTILDIDILSFFNSSDLGFSYATSLEDAMFVNITLAFNHVLLDIFPPTPEVPGEQSPYIIPSFQALSEQTLYLEDVNVSRIFLDGSFRIILDVENVGIPGHSFLAEPFAFVIDELFTVSLDWDGLVGTIGALFALNIDTLMTTEIGPLLDFIADCVVAVFQKPPLIAGASLGQKSLKIDLSQFFDAILVLVADVVEVVLPVYQTVIPQALELVIADTITGVELIEEAICPAADPFYDDMDKYPYDFTEGFISALSDNIDAELANDLLSGFEIEDEGLFIIGSNDGSDLGEGVVLPIPPIDGWTHNLSVFIQVFSVEGLIPPVLNELQLLRAKEGSPNYPQDLRTILDAGNATSPVTLRLMFNITGFPFPDPDTDPKDVAAEVPAVLAFQESVLDVRFHFSTMRILLDIFLRLSEYDVDSLGIKELINLGCWGERINWPGGVDLLTFKGEELRTEVNCTGCVNEMVLEMARVFADVNTWPDQDFFLNDALNRFGVLVADLFSIDHFEHTVRVAHNICVTGDWGEIQFPYYELSEHHTDITLILPYFAFFIFAIATPAIVARVMNKYGPKLEKFNKHHANHEHNQVALEKVKALQDQTDDEDVELLEHAHLLNPMHTNPKVPLWVRKSMPFLLLFNLILFIIGDAGNAVRIDVAGHVFLVPYAQEGYVTLSVITSVFELWRNGGWLLALLLFIMSIAWPYLKLILMTYCWFSTPQRLSVSNRGKTIEMLDFLGRFSFAEFHFLVIVLVVFQIEAGTPDSAFLPAEDLFLIKLEVVPLLSLFTFCLAVVFSIILSNAMLVWQHNIEDETRIKIREAHLKQIENTQQKNLVTEAQNKDKEKHRMTKWEFIVYDSEEDQRYVFTLSKSATIAVAFTTISATLMLILAATAPALQIEYHGFIAYLIKFAGGEMTYDLSVVELLIKAAEYYQGNYIIYFVGLVFIATITIIPIIQTGLLCVLLFKRVSVVQARKLAEVHHVISMWCCIDVFVLAILLTVLELPTVADGMAANLEFCDDVGQLMEGLFEPMGYVEQIDVDAGCLAMYTGVNSGGYFSVLAVFVLNMANFLVSKMFYFYIVDRERLMQVNGEFGEGASKKHTQTSEEVKPFHRALEKYGLIKIKFPTFATKYQNRNPMFLPLAKFAREGESSYMEPSRVQSQVESSLSVHNPMFDADDDDMPLSGANDPQKSKDTAREKLAKFYAEVDPVNMNMVDPLVKEALSRPRGLKRLNHKLRRKYGQSVEF